MALDAYLGPNYQYPSQVHGELVQWPSPAILSQDSYLSHTGGSSGLVSSRNISHSFAQMPCQNTQFVPGNVNITVHSNPTHSGTSIEESSLITDANSSLSGGSCLPSPGSYTTESLPPSCVKISGSSAGDNLFVDQTCPRWRKRQGEPLNSPTSVSEGIMPQHPAPDPPMMNFKKPRLEINQQDSFLLKNSLLPGQYPMQMNGFDPEVAASLYQQQLLQIQQLKKASLSVYNPNMLQIQPLPPQQLNADAQKQLIAMKGAMCLRRLMYYVYHQRHRPPENNIDYWRKFVAEYYSPYARKKWCLSKYHDVARHAHGVFSHAAKDASKCDLCGSNSGKGFETTFEVLPRLKKIYFDSGVIDEHLYLDCPCERILPSGFVMLVFGKAVQETIYKDFRVIHEGQLRVVFTKELKIISWEFCVRRHEELVPLRLVAAQVNELVEDAERCRNNIDDAKGSDGLPTEDLISNFNRLAEAGHRVSKNMELPLVNDLGFSKQFVRSLQISEVLNCMKDLMTYSHSNNLSPTETLKRYPKEAAKAKHTQVSKSMPQVRSGREEEEEQQQQQQATNCHTNYYQNLITEKPMTSNTSFLRPDPRQTSYMDPPSSSHADPALEQRLLNDLLQMMRKEGAKAPRSKRARGKGRYVYDPNAEGGQSTLVGGGAKEKELSSGYVLGGTVEKGEGVNSSSSSMSSRKFPDCSFIKREPDLEDDDFTSPAGKW